MRKIIVIKISWRWVTAVCCLLGVAGLLVVRTCLQDGSALPRPEAVAAMAAAEDPGIFAQPSQARHEITLDLTQPDPTPKTIETEPDDLPQIGDTQIQSVEREREPSDALRVLIYHTHTYEAYEPTPEASYTPTERWRTKDAGHNIVRVGAALAELLSTRYGMEVVHETGEFELPAINTAYVRSLAMLEAYTMRGETFDLYIDLHRDAYVDSMRNTNTVADQGVQLARLRMLIGKGEGQTGAGFTQRPNWLENTKLAERLTASLNAQVENLCRPIITKTGRFNQHISANAVLIEVGNNMNTLDEALASMPYLARAIYEAMQAQ